MKQWLSLAFIAISTIPCLSAQDKDGLVTPLAQVIVYQHADYKGASKKMGLGKYNLEQLGVGNDQLSSLKVPKGLKVTLYEHRDFTGKTFVVRNDTRFLTTFNDLTSSMVVEKDGGNNNNVVNNNNEPKPSMPSFKGCPTGTENVPAENEALEKQVMELVNQERAKLGKPALVWNSKLARAARYHAADMATEGYFEHASHDVNNGEKVKVCNTFERIGKFGKGYAENIAMGNSTAEGTMNQWMNSPGHYSNIMSDNTSIGVGFYKNHWVQVFGPKE